MEADLQVHRKAVLTRPAHVHGGGIPSTAIHFYFSVYLLVGSV